MMNMGMILLKNASIMGDVKIVEREEMRKSQE